MELEKYLELLRNQNYLENDVFTRHPHKALRNSSTLKLGIYDNWPILFKKSPQRMKRLILKKSNFKLDKEKKTSFDMRCNARGFSINYEPGTINVQFWDTLIENWLNGRETVEDSFKEHFNYQKNTYNGSMMLHWYQNKKIPEINDYQAMALAIIDIGELAINEKIPICFPNSIGWNDFENPDKIVYYNP